MAANLNGSTQSIQPFEVDIYKGLKPDVVCIQEFNYNNNTAADFRALIDDAFGTNFSYYRESGSLQIPNGIISRYPIISSGRWVDTEVSNRGFAWARIDLPGSNDLYAVSVHLLTSSSGARATEANNLKTLINANFPTNAWIVIGGDFNTDSRGETAITTFASLCPDSPIPTDAETGGDYDSNANRNKPYDYVLASRSLTNYLTNVVFASHSFPKGLVFDSRVYTPLTDVSPIVYGDSGQGQHMAILKDFSIPVSGSNAPVAPVINTQPQSQTIAVGGNATFTVSATGTAPLSYRWRLNGTNLSGALTNAYSITNAQTTNNGSYTVVITNSAGSVTSTVATLTVSNVAPTITTNPASLAVFAGETVAFSVTAAGTAPLAYQWRFNGANIAGATNDDYSFNNAQTNNAGNYTVVVTNMVGGITSAVAVLSVSNAAPVILTNPAALTVTVGGTADFTVVADGATPMDYQWRFNGADIAGADTATYSLASVQSSNAGNYTVVVTNNAGSITSAVAVLTVNAAGSVIYSGILAGWDFSSLPGGNTNYGPSPMSPTTNAPNLTIVGLTRGAGVATLNTASPRSWGGNSFDATSISAAVIANDFASLAIRANIGYKVSFTSISRFDYLRSNSGATNGVVQYQLGTNAFIDITNLTYTGTARTSLPVIDLSGISALQNVNEGTNVTFRIVSFGATSSGGNWYLADINTNAAPDFAIDGNIASTAAAPAVAADINTLVYSGGQFQFTATGTVGSNYIVQACADLSLTNWVSLVTNASPFTYSDADANTFTQRFYRVKLK